MRLCVYAVEFLSHSRLWVLVCISLTQGGQKAGNAICIYSIQAIYGTESIQLNRRSPLVLHKRL